METSIKSKCPLAIFLTVSVVDNNNFYLLYITFLFFFGAKIFFKLISTLVALKK